MSASTANETGALRIFDFCEHAVRVLNRDGEPWFVSADAAGDEQLLDWSREVAARLVPVGGAAEFLTVDLMGLRECPPPIDELAYLCPVNSLGRGIARLAGQRIPLGDGTYMMWLPRRTSARRGWLVRRAMGKGGAQ